MKFRPIFYLHHIYPKLNNNCCICLERLNKEYIYTYCKQCKQVYHCQCMSEWLENKEELSCPCSRSNELRNFWDYYMKFYKFIGY